MKIGIPLGAASDGYDAAFARLKDVGFTCCQLGGNPFSISDDDLDQIIIAREKYDIEIVSFWPRLRGPNEYKPNFDFFYEGTLTLGLVPTAYRDGRVQDLIEAVRICKKLGITNIAGHCGFIPEDPNSIVYLDIVATLRYICSIYKNEGIYFCFETGQETPVTLLRTIDDVGTGNLGVNFDPGNLLLYGKANPLDALDIIGKHVRCVHVKDGEYPTDGSKNGKEKPIGEGRASFPALSAKMKD